MITATCQRWGEGRASYRPAGEPIETRRFEVAPIASDAVARAFVERHHYSRSYPAALARVGLYRGPELVGIVVFSVPMHPAVLPKWTGQTEAAELGRLVLLDEVPANGESWFVARAFEELVKLRPDTRAVLSFSDPLARRDADGQVVKPGHVGTVYQALNARHVGRGNPATLIVAPSGEVVSRRALSKLRNDEVGARYVYDQLRALGCPPIRTGEAAGDYIHRALDDFPRVRHPGNLAYVWAMGDRRARRAVEAGLPAARPYPKLAA